MTKQSLRLLSGLFILGTIGTAAELLLLEHTEDFWQLSPLLLLGTGFVIFTISGFLDRPLVWSIFRMVMVFCILSGLVGFWMHYQTNVEFEKEMYPGISGLTLFVESMKGATPSLAPGAMIMIGLIGWLRSPH